MKQSHFNSTILLVAVLVGGCVPADAPPATIAQTQTKNADPWRVVLQRDVEQPMRVAAFLDASFGLTGGSADVGRAHVTTDGGRTWRLAESSEGCLFGLDIVDSQVVWQCALGPVGVSTDGGQTWQAVTEYDNCRQMSFLDARTGWVATRDRLGATKDGGQTWRDVPLPAGAENVLAASLRTPLDGYLVDYAGVLHVTRDGGQSWSAHPLGLDLEGILVPDRDTASAAVRFIDTDRGVVVVHLTGGLSSRVVALHTADGGQTWTREQVMEVPLLIALYLSPDGSLLTIADQAASRVVVLRRTE
jgi:photosystem II stability/assembly factor-like uncharacterized protein